ncbi:MAG: hypothetical protein AAF939_12220 [Planctomycetota bacterium]
MKVKTSIFVLFLMACFFAWSDWGQAQDLSGRWRGGWQSCNTGHQGKLNATFCRIDSTHVKANFSGTFAKVIPFRYRPVLNIVHEEPGLMVLEGSRRLPLMGQFQYQATISGQQFSASYQSRRDNGYWYLSK